MPILDHELDSFFHAPLTDEKRRQQLSYSALEHNTIMIGSITKNFKRLISIRDCQYMSVSQPSFQLVKASLTLFSTCKIMTLSSQLGQRNHYFRKAFYEAPVISC